LIRVSPSLVARSAKRAVPAWRPGPGFVLAHATTRGRVVVLEGSGAALRWQTARWPVPRKLEWSTDGSGAYLVWPRADQWIFVRLGERRRISSAAVVA
jgi:hypothetical protein